jgi:hypothetical protein
VIATDTPMSGAATVLAEPTLRLGQINERLAPIALTADGLAGLGFAPAATEKAAKLYRATDFPLICAALVRHVRAVQAGQAEQAA